MALPQTGYVFMLDFSEDLSLLKLDNVAAHRLSFAPSFNLSFRAISHKVAPQLPISVLRLIKQPSLTATERIGHVFTSRS